MANVDGLWRNSEGSCVYLRSDQSHLNGWYATRVGSSAALGKRHRLVGLVERDLIGFVVAWHGSNSITSWAGRVVQTPDGKRTIQTLWHLARGEKGDPPTPTAPWETFLTNASAFVFSGFDEPTETAP